MGRAVQRGIDLAVEQVNLAPPRGRRLRVIYEDDRSSAANAITLTRTLLERDHPVAIIGSVASSFAAACAAITGEARVPLLSPGATNAVLTTNEFAFRACFADDAQGAGAAEFAATVLGKRKFAMLHANDGSYSAVLAEAFRAKILRLGGAIVAETSYPPQDLPTGKLAPLRSVGAELVYAPIFGPHARAVASEARTVGVELLGSDAWATPDVASELEGAYYTDHFALDMPWSKASGFLAAYGARYNDARPSSLAALGYDAVLILADALGRASGDDGLAVRNALAATSGVKIATGIVSIDASRVTQKPVTVVQLAGGEPRFRAVVGPHAAEVR